MSTLQQRPVAIGVYYPSWKIYREIHPGPRVLLSIGGGTGSKQFAGVAANREKTARFCQTTKQLLDNFHLDGADIDWEHPRTPDEGADFVALLVALRACLPSPAYSITAALPANEEVLDHIDLPGLLSGPNAVIDYLNLMAYDMAGSWSAVAGHHAQLHAPTRPKHNFAKQSMARISYYLIERRKVDPHRIILGIPAYGRSFWA
ncbi:Endochitinase B [Fulvia fulva]|uniref:chitinase n=1 Tax=Passalora fulva TaxID=5499 RepID=A0A9Q8UWS4_PASFU|nr:Endochitinase B [Fulvia fulva]UJO25197.1 Endochitinase B [Fulvia fulva]WPV22472.1 Endochitinase B [Fulvia fulva]